MAVERSPLDVEEAPVTALLSCTPRLHASIGTVEVICSYVAFMLLWPGLLYSENYYELEVMCHVSRRAFLWYFLEVIDFLIKEGLKWKPDIYAVSLSFCIQVLQLVCFP